MNNSLIDGVLVPFAQALISALFTGLALGFALSLAGVERAAQFGTLAGALAALACWLSYRGKWSQLLEALLGVNNIPEPEPLPLPPYAPARQEPVRVILSSEDGREVDFIDLPAEPEQLRLLADGVLQNRPFSLPEWRGVFSRSQFERLRDEMLKRNLAVWRNPRAAAQGLELTVSGRAILKHFASEAALSSPTLRTYARRM